MKVLVLASEPPLPANSGVRVRTLELARQLARSFDVEMAALGDVESEAAEPFALTHVPSSTSRARALALSLWQPYLHALTGAQRLRGFVDQRRWDNVQATLPWTVDVARRAGVPVVLDAHNVEADVARTTAERETRPPHRLRWRWEANKIERYERRIVCLADAVCTPSEADADRLAAFGARSCVVVPNGVDTSAFAHRRPAPGAVALYPAHFGYRPNVVAAFELIHEVLPRLRETVPDAVVRFVGKGIGPRLQSHARPGVEFAGEAPAIAHELHRARVLVVPLRSGSGTRLKVLEAMSAGLPVVSTSFGVAGIDVVDGRHVLLAESGTDLAAQASRVIQDDELAARLSTEARSLVERHYDWSITAAPLVALHRRLAGLS